MSYTVRYVEEVVKKHIPSLPVGARKTIKRAIEERLSIDPVGLGKPLQYSLNGYRRLRVGDYRIVYRIDKAANTVTIIAIKHRKDVYRDLV